MCSIILGLLAAFGWLVSCYLWWRSTDVKFEPIIGTVIEPSIFQDYFAETGKRNRVAAGVSAVSALLSAGSLIAQNIGW